MSFSFNPREGRYVAATALGLIDEVAGRTVSIPVRGVTSLRQAETRALQNDERLVFNPREGRYVAATADERRESRPTSGFQSP